MKTKLLVALATVVGGLTSAYAQSTAPAATTAPSYSITTNITAVSQYMFRGQRLGGFSFQPSVELATGDLALGVWSNFPISDKVPDTSDPEFDLYGSYTFKINDALSIVPGFTWYVYPDAPEALGFYKNTFEPSIALNYTIGGLKLTPKIYYDVSLEGPTYEATAAYTIPAKQIGTELNFVATYGSFIVDNAVKGSNPATKSWGDYWLVGVTAPFEVTKNSKFILGFAYTEGRDAFFKTGSAPKSVNSLAVGRGVVTATYSLSF